MRRDQGPAMSCGRNIPILSPPASYFHPIRSAAPMDMTAATPWWDPQVYADRRGFLDARRRIVASLRRWFEAHDFAEVETSILQRSPGNELHLHAFATKSMSPSGHCAPLHLRTSPEFACKKLLAAGERRLFEFARAFRNRERGALHHPEFTLLEWYRAGEGYEAVMRDGVAIVRAAAKAAGKRALSFRGGQANAFAEPERITVADAFMRFAGIDLLATVGRGEPDREAFAWQASAANIRVSGDDTWSDIFSRVMVERVEPRLGLDRLTILHEYPAPEAALARVKPDDPRVAERFELFACGIELANGFGELTDAAEQRRRFSAAMAEKERLYGERYPVDEDFLAALDIMPEASGCALGLDRLVMLATGTARIEQVLWTPVAEA
jgi:elongation factor P--(R)-beta-lysine ligase